MNKLSGIAGTFYPEKEEELHNLLEYYKRDYKPIFKSKAIIVPHAGYVYSGHAAMRGFMHLEQNENVFIIAPSHHYNFDNIAFPDYSFFETPFGSVEVNNRLIKEIAENFPCVIENQFFENEHSIEVQLPLMQSVFYHQKQSAADFVKNLAKSVKKVKIVPVLVGRCDYTLISDLISAYWENSSFVISSDLSHFYTHDECRKIDTYTATIIENGKTDFFEPEQACGLTGIKGLVDFANNNGCSLIRAEMYNSGDISGEKDKVVGYGSWYLSAERKNDFLKKYYSDYILNTTRQSILSTLNEQEYVPDDIPCVMSEFGASFITLKKNGELRGCIGSIYPTKPLLLDIIDNSRNAAFHDSRFEPISTEEFNNLEIEISLLSSIERINFKDERDLLSKIYPYGIIIAERDRRAVYLPVVWEQLPDREFFLNSLKEKAGLPPDYFSRTFEAYKFDTTNISSDNRELV